MRLGFLLTIGLFPAAGFSAQVLKVRPAKGVAVVGASVQEEEQFSDDKSKKIILHNKRTREDINGTYIKKLEKGLLFKVEAIDQLQVGDELSFSREEEKEEVEEEDKREFSPLSFKEIPLNSPFFMAPAFLATYRSGQLGFKVGFHKHNYDMEFGGEHFFKKLKGHKLNVFTAVVDNEIKLHTMLTYENEHLKGDANLYGTSAELTVGRTKGGLAFARPIKKNQFLGLGIKPQTVLLQGRVFEFRKHLFYWHEINISYLKIHKPFQLGLMYTPGHSLSSDDGDDVIYQEEGDKLTVFGSWPKRKNMILYGNVTYWLNTQKLGSNPNNSSKNAYELFFGGRFLVKKRFQLESAFKLNSSHFYSINRYTDEKKIAYRSIYLSVLTPFLKLGSYGASVSIRSGDDSESSNKISSNQWTLSLQTALKF
ncbi:MAG: hypothetical protein HRU09_11915 [Oligoflexales bacterium]|nr:hypothetical protein [Oligoflexales bacterium]